MNAEIKGRILVFKDINNKRWTIWSLDRKKHLGYADTLLLKNAEFYVNQDSWKRIVKTGKRYPHAWIIGDVVNKAPKGDLIEINYNPFKDLGFKTVNSESVNHSSYVIFSKNQVLIKK